MNLLFCDRPFGNKPTVDIDYEAEFAAAKQAGFVHHLLSHEALTRNEDAALATRSIRRSDTLQTMIYRGWMLKPALYTALYDALRAKNYELINTPTEYQNGHCLPDSYRFIRGHTPDTVWLALEDARVDYDRVFDLISRFGNSPLIVKDFVKSQKHYWDTACFIPSAADRDQVKSVVDKFVALQGSDINGGLVFREYVELNDLAVHSKSGMPLKQEHRLFFFQSSLLHCYDYWEEGAYADVEKPPLEEFISIAKGVESSFFSMDLAKTKEGSWIIVELGDGQVAGLPDSADKPEFYSLLRSGWTS